MQYPMLSVGGHVANLQVDLVHHPERSERVPRLAALRRG